jgi:hypothetical protein
LTQLLPVGQAAQWSTSEQPSEMTPHWPGSHAAFGVQLPFLTQTLATQTRLPLQPPPQLMAPLQPSGMTPQSLPTAVQLVGVQPHAFGLLPPPHDCGQLQPPQSSVWPQPSEALPQL